MFGNERACWHQALLYQLRCQPLPAFQVEDQALRDCLIKHSITIRGEFVTRPLNITQAADRRDAFVKVQSCGRRGLHVYVLSVAPCLVSGQQGRAESWASPDSASPLSGDRGLPRLSRVVSCLKVRVISLSRSSACGLPR